MTNNRKQFKNVSKSALVVLVLLTIVAVWTNIYIMMSTTLKNIGFPGTLSMLFDYSKYASGHSARFTGQILSNVVAYVFMLVAVILFIASLALVKHDKGVKAKCAIIALGLFIPATVGLTGGIVNFFGEGMKTLSKYGGSSIASLLGLVILTFVLDVVYLILACVTLVKGIRTAVKVNRGELVVEPDEDYRGHQETPEEKAAREEKEAADRVALLADIRQIVREELDRLDRVVIAKEATVVKEAVKPAPVANEVEEVPFKGKSAPRVPFAKKMVKADKEIQDKYNEIKNDILAYGAKSRVSIAGDTFRLHRKPYVKITLVGKTLKVYYALKAKDFEDSPIPVVDASDKASYEEVPALLKVKSNLSVKRAKELTRLAMEADGVEQKSEPEDHNWIKDLRSELRKN